MTKYSAPEKLSKNHKIKSFNCGSEQLNEYLKKYAFQNQKKNISNTFVTENNGIVTGYYTLTFGSVSKLDLPIQKQKRLPNYPIPVMIIGRLAVDKKEQGNGLGKSLLKDAILRTIQASEIAGIKAIMVHAKNENAKSFYLKYDFIESSIDDLLLFLPIDFIK